MNPFEEVVWDLFGEEVNDQGLPPGFRFHPTDEELVTFYLASKVFNGGLCGLDIVEVDLNRCEPWELPDVAKMGEREWYFFSLRDRKYPTGLRTNRATGAGYWKATGKDREVRAAAAANGGSLVGMKKTLVFYMGRAPRGEKTKWVLHEYRLDGDYSCRHSCKEEWVICRIFNKSTTSGAEHKKNLYYPDPNYYNNLDLPPSSPTSSCLPPPLPQLQSIDSSLLQNHNTTTTSPLLPLPQSLIKYPSSSLTLQEEEGADPFSNWLDAYYYDMLPFGGPSAAGGGGASSHDYVSSIF